MQRRHRALLSSSHEFLVNEIPMDAMLEAIRNKRVLSWHDFEQLKTLRHQGRRALARYFLAVLPHRGSRAFQAFLESLQEANAQHLVDLLLQQAGAMNLDELLKESHDNEENDSSTHKRLTKTPSDTPLPPGPDPHEYAIKLIRNARYIREFVDPAVISPILVQNKVITSREADMVLHLNGRNKKWDLIMSALLQRGERAYQAFIAALLQKDYSSVFHAIQETIPELSGSESDHGVDDNRESDEEIKEEEAELRKRASLADEFVGVSTNVSTADILLTRSRDLVNINDDVGNSLEHSKKEDGSRLHIRNNSRDSFDG